MATSAVGPREDRLVRAVARAGSEPDPARAAECVLMTLRAAVGGASGGAVLLMHPQSGMFWTGAVAGVPVETCHPFFRNELASGPDSLRRMAATRAPARALRLRGTDPALLEDVLTPFGFQDELRAVLTHGGVTWAGVSLWSRSESFTEEDEALLESVADAAGAALRRSVLSALDGGTTAPRACGTLIVEAGRLVECRVDDAGLRRELAAEQAPGYRHLSHLVALAGTDPQFSTVLRTADGRWLSAHAMPIASGRTVVMLMAASPADLLGHRIAGSGLSAREVEVTRLLCRGLTDSEIAAELVLSPHTVHDHVRAVRTKLGVRNRAAVVAKVFDEAYFDSFVASAALHHD